jgi:hypothetical protein
MAPWWSIATKTFINYMKLGYDPKVNPNGPSVWITSGISGGEFGNIVFTQSLGTHKKKEDKVEDMAFPTLTATWSCWEENQWGLPQNYPNSLTSISFSGSLNDGYNINNPLPNTADGYINPNLSITSISPTSGSAVNGDTLVYISGTAFLPYNTYTVSFNGAIAKSPRVVNQNLISVITNQSINSNTGLGNVIISDNNGNSFTLINGWTYT